MSEYRTIKKAVLDTKYKPTGKTKHYKALEVDLNSEDISMEKCEIQMPHSVEIAQFDGDTAYYLIYKDEFDQELTDTYHETLESALKQAEWEFNLRAEEW
jgi:hypothetical protein